MTGSTAPMGGAAASGTAAPGNIVFDLDGVLYLAGEAIDGAAEALSDLDSRGYRFVFATNNSTAGAAAVAGRIEHLCGYPARPGQVVTSGMAACSLITGSDSPAFVLGEEGLVQTLRSAGIEITVDPGRARSVFVGLDRNLTYERLRDAATAVLAGARFIATNEDPTFPTPGGLWPGSGSIAAAVALTAGTEPEIAGKPHEPMRRAVEALLGCGPTWAIGDKAETDIALARAAGWSSVLTLSGVTPDAGAIPAGYTPDLILESIADLPSALP